MAHRPVHGLRRARAAVSARRSQGMPRMLTSEGVLRRERGDDERAADNPPATFTPPSWTAFRCTPLGGSDEFRCVRGSRCSFLMLLPSARSGSGPPLLLLHGLGTTRADFAQVLGRLADDFDVLAVDLPGQGDAAPVVARPTVAALADALERDLDARGLERVHILGNSLGARIALELARRHRARSVVALAPSGLSIPSERLFQMLGMAASGALFRRAASLRAFGATAPAACPAGRPACTTLEGGTERNGQRSASGFGSPHFWALLVWAIGADVPHNLDHIDCPVLLAQGAVDLIAAGQTVRFLACIPDARFRVLPLAGHAAQADTPDVVAELVARHHGPRCLTGRLFQRSHDLGRAGRESIST